jgi:hypothetical protein
MPDYVIFFVAALLAVVGAGLLRVGLMKSRGLFIALGIASGIAAVLILVLRVVEGYASGSAGG